VLSPHVLTSEDRLIPSWGKRPLSPEGHQASLVDEGLLQGHRRTIKEEQKHQNESKGSKGNIWARMLREAY